MAEEKEKPEDDTEDDFKPGDVEDEDGKDAAGAGAVPPDTEAPQENGTMAMMKEATAEAAELGVMVPEDCATPKEWIEHFVTAIKTHKATKSAAEPPVDDTSTAAPEVTPKEEQPAVTMSLEQQKAYESRIQALEQDSSEQRLRNMNAIVDNLVTAGRVTNATGKTMKETLTKKQLSLLPGRQDQEIYSILAKVELAKETPEGTFWTPEEKKAQLSLKGAKLETPPNFDREDAGGDVKDQDAVKKILDEQFNVRS